MLVRFTKNLPAAPADTLTCVRPDGTTTEAAMPRQGILPHEAFHFVVETTLAWRNAFFGAIAAGETITAVTARLHAPAKKSAANLEQALQAEALIACLEASQWGGTPDPAAFTKQLAQAARARHVPPPALSDADLTRLRTALRDLGALWRPLASGKVIERSW